MSNLQNLIDQIPIRHDFSSHFVLMGILQGLFLAFIILLRNDNKNRSTVLFGMVMLVTSIVILDNYLCYTGLMKYVLHANDSTEPLVLLISPLLYLFLFSLLKRKPVTFKKHWFHFLPAVLYAITQIGYYFQPLAVKYNAYLGAYHSNLPFAEIPEHITYNYHWIKDEFRWMSIASFVIYTTLGFWLLFNAGVFRFNLQKSLRSEKYRFNRNTVFLMLLSFIVVLAVFLNFDDDAGDHYIGILNTLIAFSASFVLLSESQFFENSWIADKYETLGAKNQLISIEDIRLALEKDSYFLAQNVSIGELAKILDTNTNHVSRIINSELGVNFNEFVNRYRIRAAKEKLLNPDYANLTIEAIGNSVGFKSKSSFYAAFKKETKLSPSDFVKQAKG